MASAQSACCRPVIPRPLEPAVDGEHLAGHVAHPRGLPTITSGQACSSARA